MNSIFKAMVYTILVLGCANAHAVWSLGNCGWQGTTLSSTATCSNDLSGMGTAVSGTESYIVQNFKPLGGPAAPTSAPPPSAPAASSSSNTSSSATTNPQNQECGTCLECTPCTTP